MRACTVCGSALTSRGGAPSNSILARAIRMGLAVCVGWGGGMVRGARLVTPGGVGAAGWQRVSKSPRPEGTPRLIDAGTHARRSYPPTGCSGWRRGVRSLTVAYAPSPGMEAGFH
jgi:hypothetical protein